MSLHQFPVLAKFATFTKPMHFWRIAVGYTFGLLLGTFPFLIALIGNQFYTGFPGDNPYAMIAWYGILTLPLGAAAIVIWTILWIQTTIRYFRNKTVL